MKQNIENEVLNADQEVLLNFVANKGWMPNKDYNIRNSRSWSQKVENLLIEKGYVLPDPTVVPVVQRQAEPVYA